MGVVFLQVGPITVVEQTVRKSKRLMVKPHPWALLMQVLLLRGCLDQDASCRVV